MPANLQGATRLAAEKSFVAANNPSGDLGTRFSVLRLPALLDEPHPGQARPHQVLVSLDEARTTRDLGSVFVIEPQFAEWRRRAFADHGLGSAMPEAFCFSSASALAGADLDSVA